MSGKLLAPGTPRTVPANVHRASGRGGDAWPRCLNLRIRLLFEGLKAFPAFSAITALTALLQGRLNKTASHGVG